MNMNIKVEISNEILTWATYTLIMSSEKLSKKKILQYVRSQVEMFGTDMISLAGEGYISGEVDDAAFEYATEYVKARDRSLGWKIKRKL